MKLLQYQESVSGIPSSLAPERTTPDKWQPNTNIPQSNWQKAALYSAAAVMPFFTLNLTPLQRIEQPKVFAPQSVVVTVPQTTQYQVLAYPIAGFSPRERTTPDKWQSQNNQPVFDTKRQQFSYPSFFANPIVIANPEVITSDKWQPNSNQPLFDTKRQQTTFPSLVVDPLQLTRPERVSFDKWNYQQSLPRWDIPRNQFLYPSLAVDTKPLAERTTPDKWLPLPNQPRFDVARNQHLYPPFSTDAYSLTQKETPKVFGSESIILWFTRNTQYQGLAEIVRAAETINADKWIAETQKPQFDIKRLQFTYPSFFANILPIEEPADFQDAGIRQTNIPLFDVKRTQYLYQSFSIDVRQFTLSESPKVFSTESLVLSYPRNTQYQALTYVNEGNLQEQVNLDKWFRETNRPVFDVKRQQFLYPTFPLNPYGLTQHEVPKIFSNELLVITTLRNTQYQTLTFTSLGSSAHETISLGKWFRETQQPFFIPHNHGYIPYFFEPRRRFPFRYTDKYNTQNTNFNDKYSTRNSSYTDKYSNRGSNYSDKYSSRGTGYSDKYSKRNSNYSDKYPA